jgi:signal transduction histidine kinase
MLLRSSQIAVVAPRSRAAAQARVNALRRAGAAVRFCVLSQNLWSALSEASFDLIVVLAEHGDAESIAICAQLRADPRTRSVPVLLVADLPRGETPHGAALLTETADDRTLVDVATDLVMPMRRLREAEVRERQARGELRAELGRADQSAKQLLDLGHELRAMLGAVMGFACNMRDEVAGPLSSDQRSHVAGILDAVERAAKLLDAQPALLIPSARPSAAPAAAAPRAQRSMVHLAHIAAEVAALFAAVASRKAMQIRCDFDQSVCVWGDSLQLKQVLTNLVMNALKYTPAGGHVTILVRWSRPSGTGSLSSRRAAELVVHDSGPGIPLAYRDRIFERGFRIDQHAQVGGDGIGLAVVFDLVTQHGGTVRVEGEPGNGAVFLVSLPQDRRQRAPDAAAEGSAA